MSGSGKSSLVFFTLARSEESWEGLLPGLLKGYSRRTLDRDIGSVLAHLKAEAERRAATA